MELVILLSALLTLVCFWSMLDWHRKEMYAQFNILQNDIQFYGNQIEEKVDSVQECLSVAIGENIEKL